MSTSAQPAPSISKEERLTLFFRVYTITTEDDERIFNTLRQVQSDLDKEISAMVPAILGSLFRLERTEIRRGSVEFWVYVAGGFTMISQYADFIRSVELLVSQIQNLLRQTLAGIGVMVRGGWTSVTGGRKRRFNWFPFQISQEFLLFLLVLYLIASHAVLLGVFIRLTWHLVK